jgi:hypothetical protein
MPATITITPRNSTIIPGKKTNHPKSSAYTLQIEFFSVQEE